VASCHGIYRGGLGVHLSLVAMGSGLGMHIDLVGVPQEGVRQDAVILYSESPGRFIVTLDPKHRLSFEALFVDLPCACVGTVSHEPDLVVTGLDGRTVIQVPVSELKAAWKRPFGGLV
jgi:phosphoribosylformylglycinamidine (FGAM) synthase-like enzyme